MKRIICIAITLCIMLSCFTVSTLAVDERTAGDNSRFTGLVLSSAGLDISSLGRAVVSVDVALRDGYTAELHVALRQEGVTSLTSEYVKEWNPPALDEGGGAWAGVYYVAAGYAYYAEVTIYVYNLNGTLIETVNIESNAVYY